MNKLYFVILSIIYLAVIESSWACNIPVFRYALEYWPQDNYEITIYHKDSFTAEENIQIEKLREYSNSKDVNINISIIDLSIENNEIHKNIPDSSPDLAYPRMIVNYPTVTNIKDNVWDTPVNSDNISKLIDSPVRQKICRDILDENSAVWILLESGDKEKDDNIENFLETYLKELEGTLKLPDPVEGNNYVVGDEPEVYPDKIKFSLHRLSRNDPQEQLTIQMLLNTESDLGFYNEPLAFPVFGRGRILYALVGKGITKENVEDTCKFILGPCSCVVKDLNPGIDLLMHLDWNSSIKESPVSGIAATIDTSTNDVSNNIIRNIILAVAFLLLVVIMVIYIIIKNKYRKVV